MITERLSGLNLEKVLSGEDIGGAEEINKLGMVAHPPPLCFVTMPPASCVKAEGLTGLSDVLQRNCSLYDV